jgi:hypothetical protein
LTRFDPTFSGINSSFPFVLHESEIKAQKQDTKASWVAKIQWVEELSHSTRVTDVLLL